MAQPVAVGLLREAMAAARANDTPRARELVKEATRLDPGNENAWLWLAGISDAPQDALAAYERVLALNPANDKAKAGIRPVRLQVGIAAARAKDLPTARRLLRAVVADDPEQEQGWVWLAGVSESIPDAIAHLNRALAVNPNSAVAKKGLDYYHAKLRGGGGTDFHAEPPSGKMPLPDPALPTPPPAAPLEPPRPQVVLAVEPSRTLRKIIGLCLADDGLTLAEAGDGIEAVEKLKEDGPPAVIVAAATLPGIDGYELCRLVRKHPDTAPVPVVLLTDRDGLRERVWARRAGADAHLPKPLRPAALRAAILGFRAELADTE